ncbi:MAG TPA: potassium-transporting ATPase subunit KdpA [Magnetospirillaceae bacterium]|nr:potassium-transporting ATPase subunit KdpA [Magnetospirillaceae bacterium]
MNIAGILQIVVYCALLLATALPLGLYLARVYEGQGTWLSPVLAPIERGILAVCGVRRDQEQHWTAYAVSLLIFNLVTLLALYAILRLQAYLPFNPAGETAMTPDLAFNTAVSFTTNTNWQNYGGESTLSYFSQMAGLTVHNFTSAATGMCVAVALIRGFSRRSTKTLGNFYVDLVRGLVHVLLPMAILFTIFLVWQGVPQNLDAYTSAVGLDGASQTIAQGPIASQTAIKLLGTNGGGFFNANSAHPFENPTPLSNFLQMWSIVVISAGLVFAFGKLVKDFRQGRALFIAMSVMMVAGILLCYWAEAGGNPLFTPLGIDQVASDINPGGNMEGKELRFGIVNSALFATVTTDTSCGAVNAFLDSFTPLGGLVPLFDMMLSEVIFGGVGAGLHGMIIFVIVTVFIAGLMVGRTPEYLGKKMEAKEVKLAVLAILVFPLSILGLGALSVLLPAGTAAISAPGPHGLTEALYAYTSTTANNGSAFGGFSGNSLYQNTMLAVAMLLGRFIVIVPTLAIAGSVAAKKLVPASAGTFPTHGTLFIGLLIAIVVVVGGLTFFPFIALGPLVEHLSLVAGTSF